MSRLFIETGEALYGTRWQTDLARDLEMSARHIRRLATGSADMTPGIARDLRNIAVKRRQHIDQLLCQLEDLAHVET